MTEFVAVHIVFLAFVAIVQDCEERKMVVVGNFFSILELVETID